MIGLPVFLRSGYTSEHQAFCQVPGPSLRLKHESFSAVLADGGGLNDLLLRYTEALFAQVAQSSACNRLHAIEQRCARWILQTHDRIEDDEFDLTQQFLAQMLGVQRTSVSAVASTLQERGVILYKRGHLTILDRRGLEADACECYEVIQAEYEDAAKRRIERARETQAMLAQLRANATPANIACAA
jgi:hypothetical protein